MNAFRLRPHMAHLWQALAARPWREFALFCLAGMEIAWASLLYRALPLAGLDIPYERALIFFFLLVIVALLAARGMNALQWPLPRRRWVLLGLLALSLLFGSRALLRPHPIVTISDMLSQPIKSFADITVVVPAEFVAFTAIILLYWRGIELAALHIEPIIVLKSFRTGMLALIAYGIFIPRFDSQDVLGLYLFICFALMGLGAGRIYALSKLRGGRATPFDRRWVLGMLLAIVALLIFAGAAIVGLREVAAGLLLSVFQALRDVFILLVLILIIPPLTLFLQLLVNIGRWGQLTEIIAQLSEAVNRLLQVFEGFFGKPLEFAGTRLPFLKPLALVTILALLVLLTLASLRIQARKRRAAQPETLQALADEESQNLKGLLRRGMRSLAERLAGLNQLRHPRRLLAAARIRRVYAALLFLSAKLGTPRPAAQTPHEFLIPLKKLFPELAGELTAITEAYQRVRYGQLPETIGEVQVVNDSWRRIAQEGRSRLSAGGKSKQK